MRPGTRILCAIGALCITLVLCPAPAYSQDATNIILFIGDGMGYQQVEAGRYFVGSNLVFETWPYQGQVTTHSVSGEVTDSAAAGTAMAHARATATDRDLGFMSEILLQSGNRR